MTTFYNEWEPKTAAWLRELARQGHITNGVVDERSIKDIQPDEVRGYRRAHFFAGIGGWDYALRLAGWPDDRPVWTGSCPCQSESLAGERRGAEDPRHLWPDFFGLIKERQPATVFGEQVDAAAKSGWIDLVRTDLEAEGYAFGFHVLGAHSAGAWHIRQRIFWVADRVQQRGAGLVKTGGPCEVRPWWPCGKKNLQSVYERPYSPGAGWPQPMLRSVDDGLSTRVDGVLGAGNAIVPQVAAAFVRAFMEAA